MMKLSDLPENCKDLIEVLELILAGEMLANESDYRIMILDDSWIIYLENLISVFVPKVVSQYTPPTIQLTKSFIQNKVSDIDLFEKELRENKIVIVKYESYRNMGYTVMGGKVRKEAPFWQFYFPDQKKIYDFYLICKKYGVF